ncbi:MAG TPA: winged helix-turn-helix domain-containing protein [Bacteroidales bacterium]|nr:winged helix-turn-helix domain-containing protein [Bacteroidales bacterium]
MFIEKIGTNAGLVWTALENGEMEFKALAKVTKLTQRDVQVALGWLAREGKVSFREDDKDLYIALV